MAAEQLPSAAAYTLGGQSTVANTVVGQEVDGFMEEGEAKQTAAGQHACDITYSRRKTKSLTLELGNGADPTDYAVGGYLDYSFSAGGTAAWEITSCRVTKTRGPVQVSLDLVSLTEDITALA